MDFCPSWISLWTSLQGLWTSASTALKLGDYSPHGAVVTIKRDSACKMLNELQGFQSAAIVVIIIIIIIIIIIPFSSSNRSAI